MGSKLGEKNASNASTPPRSVVAVHNCFAEDTECLSACLFLLICVRGRKSRDKSLASFVLGTEEQGARDKARVNERNKCKAKKAWKVYTARKGTIKDGEACGNIRNRQKTPEQYFVSEKRRLWRLKFPSNNRVSNKN